MTGRFPTLPSQAGKMLLVRPYSGGNCVEWSQGVCIEETEGKGSEERKEENLAGLNVY